MRLPLALGVSALLMAGAGEAAAQANRDTVPARSKLFPIDPTAYLLGRFRADTTTDFVRLPPRITDGRRAYLRTEAARALGEMVAAAQEAGRTLTVVSATRSYAAQRDIWNAKFTGARRSMGQNLAEAYPDTGERCLAILQYSSAPGLSRHHWGTDVDLNSTAPAYWRTPAGVAVLEWLTENAQPFGYYLAYPQGREHGYRYEPWHWSYQPLARPLVRRYFDRLISDEALTGFLGASQIRELPWKRWYVKGVNEALK